MKPLLIILLLISPTLSAETRLDIHGLSYHSIDTYRNPVINKDYYKETKFNNKNYGIGVTQSLNSLWSVSIGSYENSYWKVTDYLLANYKFYSGEGINIGGSIGVATGYDHRPIFVMVPTVHFKILKIGVIPKLSRETTNSLFISLSVRIL